MIKNVIFDMGGVLLNYYPDKHMESLGFDRETIDYLYNNMFYNEAWLEVDRGTRTFKQTEDYFCELHPKYEKEIRFVLRNKVLDFLSVKEETSDFLKQLKAEGYNIYILSNFSGELYELIMDRFDYFNFVDEKIISGYIGMIKPNEDIYRYTIDKLGIVPDETIFIDDVQRNIDGAARLGIKTVLFTNIDEVKQKVRVLLDE